MPVRYIHRNVARKRLPGLYRAASVALVTPLRDGMNLVAKEFVAAQDPEDPGVLVLSRFAGAAEQLTEALLVNPYDTRARPRPSSAPCRCRWPSASAATSAAGAHPRARRALVAVAVSGSAAPFPPPEPVPFPGGREAGARFLNHKKGPA
jgi:hypothetical protein